MMKRKNGVKKAIIMVALILVTLANCAIPAFAVNETSISTITENIAREKSEATAAAETTTEKNSSAKVFLILLICSIIGFIVGLILMQIGADNFNVYSNNLSDFPCNIGEILILASIIGFAISGLVLAIP